MKTRLLENYIIFIDTPEHVNDGNKNARKLYIIFIDIPEQVNMLKMMKTRMLENFTQSL